MKYAHLEGIELSIGEIVRHGQRIGRTEGTRSSTGGELHLECLFNGERFNPYFYFENGEGGIYADGDPTGSGDAGAAALLAEADNYVGYPYVWGGSRPSTSFDCSGFVCWCLTNSGYFNMPRTTAQGIFNKCARVSPSEARAGDLIFFTGTYNSGNPVSHVGIYCGNGTMVHAGDPIKYSRIDTPYWNAHYYAYGRLPGK